MLKRNLVRTVLVLHGLLLLVLMPNVTALKGEPVNHWHQVKAENGEFISGTADSTMPAVITEAVTTEIVKDSVAAPQVQLNKQAVSYLKSFLKREEGSLARVKRRSNAYFKIIDTIFTRYGLPVELKYLAVIESDLMTSAVSRVGAKGMWQLMPGTARDLGLKVNKKTDERTHVYKSTVAAAKYLRDLYTIYGDWLLVLAAYNGGPGRVNYAIKKSGSRNFWKLQKFLPEESRGHVKRFIGTHYYFENKGSITTLTKAEATAYKKSLLQYQELMAKNQQTRNETANETTAFAR